MTPSKPSSRIAHTEPLGSPHEVLRAHPLSSAAASTVDQARTNVHRVLHGADDRLIVVVGPCSIHDAALAFEYADRLAQHADQWAKDLVIIMRVYFEKPRTTVGWKGLINDPMLDGSFQINDGLTLARSILMGVNERGIPAGAEFLDTITPAYWSDLVSWGAVGARTTESQVHREMASSLPCAIGFKNGTDGNVKISVDAVRAAQQPHHFPSILPNGRAGIVHTTGNEDTHIILRGGQEPNYSAVHVQAAAQSMANAGVAPRIMIDLSHGNSSKDHRRQPMVADDVALQLEAGDRRIVGVMVEGHLVDGRQDMIVGQPLVHGQSITDACLGWDTTVTVLDRLASAVRARRRFEE